MDVYFAFFDIREAVIFSESMGDEHRCAGITDSAKDLYCMIKDKKPDLLISNISLKYADLMWVIESLQADKIEIPKIIVVTTIARSTIIQYLSELAGNHLLFIMFQPVDLDLFVKRVKLCSKRFYLMFPVSADIRTQLRYILEYVGVDFEFRGAYYILEGLVACIDHPEYAKNINRQLVPAINEMFPDRQPSSIQVGIYRTISSVPVDSDQFREVFRQYPSMEPMDSTKMFISGIIEAYHMLVK